MTANDSVAHTCGPGRFSPLRGPGSCSDDCSDSIFGKWLLLDPPRSASHRHHHHCDRGGARSSSAAAAAAPPPPCVCYVHGNASCRIEALGQLSLVLSLGCSYVALDCAGSGLSDGEYVSLGHFEQDDLKAGSSDDVAHRDLAS